MATAQPTPAPSQPPPRNEITIFSHSSLFYWWPVWAVGFILGALTMFKGHVMIVVPKKVEFPDVEKKENRIVETRMVLPGGVPAETIEGRHRAVAPTAAYGVLFTLVLLVVIVITNVPLRGMWSVLVIMFLILMSIIFALAGWWDDILGAIYLLDIRINAAGYFVIALGLFGIWLVTFLAFDRQLYIVFQPGIMKVRLEIGAGEKAYDTIGMSIERERSDLFRHWILGLGSGDLIIKTSGAERHEFRLNNVLFIGRKLQGIEDMANRM